MSYLVVTAAAVGAGIIQTVTGFGAGIFTMLVIPYFFDMIAAPALSSAICLGLSVSLAWKFRKQINWKTCIPPTLLYTVFSVASIRMVKNIDLDLLTLVFGVFLVVLSVWFLAFSTRVSFQANWKTSLESLRKARATMQGQSMNKEMGLQTGRVGPVVRTPRHV